MPASPLLLALTTATETCGVALWQDEGVAVELTLERPRRHAEHLVPLIQDALRHGEVTPDALNAVALAGGPGSYTGLRIGASTAKGLVRATGAKLVAVPTLEALAEAARPFTTEGDLLGATLRSRRGEVYVAAYHIDGSKPEPVFAAEALTTEEAACRLRASYAEANRPGAVWLLGSGAPRVIDAFETLNGTVPPVRLVERTTPTASAVARLGTRRLRHGTVEDAAAFEPHYLKPFHTTPRRTSVFQQRS